MRLRMGFRRSPPRGDSKCWTSASASVRTLGIFPFRQVGGSSSDEILKPLEERTAAVRNCDLLYSALEVENCFEIESGLQFCFNPDDLDEWKEIQVSIASREKLGVVKAMLWSRRTKRRSLTENLNLSSLAACSSTTIGFLFGSVRKAELKNMDDLVVFFEFFWPLESLELLSSPGIAAEPIDVSWGSSDCAAQWHGWSCFALLSTRRNHPSNYLKLEHPNQFRIQHRAAA
jgi:hypothetical protein